MFLVCLDAFELKKNIYEFIMMKYKMKWKIRLEIAEYSHRPKKIIRTELHNSREAKMERRT